MSISFFRQLVLRFFALSIRTSNAKARAEMPAVLPFRFFFGTKKCRLSMWWHVEIENLLPFGPFLGGQWCINNCVTQNVSGFFLRSQLLSKQNLWGSLTVRSTCTASSAKPRHWKITFQHMVSPQRNIWGLTPTEVANCQGQNCREPESANWQVKVKRCQECQLKVGKSYPNWDVTLWCNSM